METFLKLVAKDLLERYGKDLSKVAVVFPNKRASLFFNQALALLARAPVWAPAYLSISDLFTHFSKLQKSDTIQLVCELYKVFQSITGRDESLDDFYFWGEMLIADFDDVDKNLVDADCLFSNLDDWRALSAGSDFLDEEQEAAIQQFFQNFSLEKRTELKERFLSVWNVLGDIYTAYKMRLSQNGIAYEGMLYRDALSHLSCNELRHEVYVFVGFNVLNKVETRLFATLRDAGKALFYWDYDEFYLKDNHEAGEFIRRNLQLFPQALQQHRFASFGNPKQVRIIGAPTENAQARFVAQWMPLALRADDTHSPGICTGETVLPQECAVVLCNETLLQPVLHSLPALNSPVNVTMGFPLTQTPVYSFLSLLLDVQADYQSSTQRFAYNSVVALLNHQFAGLLSDESGNLRRRLTESNRFRPTPGELAVDGLLEKLFTPVQGNLALCDTLLFALKKVSELYRSEPAENTETQLYSEAVFRCYTVVSRFRTLIDSGGLLISIGTFRRLLNRVLASTSIPFHGDPAIGVQVMGVLETRNLDFRHLVMLSVNEGLLPQKAGESSFIPYNLRKAYGMTTIEHKNAVYAYYFYRLLQRAEDVTLLYNTSMDGLNQGERSRFLLQYLIESPHRPIQAMLYANQQTATSAPLSVPKTAGVMRRLHKRFEHTSPEMDVRFTPSALNTYIDCSLKFYYKYVARLKAPDVVNDEIDSALFGSIFHRAAELLYDELTSRSKLIRKEDIEALLADEVRLRQYVDAAFKELFFQIPSEEHAEYNGIQLIHFSVINKYLKRLLQRDKEYAPFVLEQTEYPALLEIDVELGGGAMLHTSIGGIIDRMDSKDHSLRIVDYKTGGQPKRAESVDMLFRADKNRANHVFQAFLYAYVMQHKLDEAGFSDGLKRVMPSLLYIHKSFPDVIEIGKNKDKTVVDDFGDCADDFRRGLDSLIAEIFDANMPFVQTEMEDKCIHCDFKELCGKK